MNQKAIKAMEAFLEAIDIDIKALGMEKTPERVANMYGYLFNGCGKDTADVWGELFQGEGDGLVAVRDIPFYSMCEHHLVPFFGKISVVYKPHNGMVAGFSKFSKAVEILSHRPQLQERLTEQLAEAIATGLKAEGVLVVIEAQQLCMTMRGDMAHGTSTITTACRGSMEKDGADYAQSWHLLGSQQP